jgi:2-keto-4-pentenoate hydratase/2-oxohepta-3-ene-1,7-dioic acid hydratase in catechol pathway
MTLEDGDVVMTGTPKGVGVIENGVYFFAKVLLNSETLLSQTWQAS